MPEAISFLTELAEPPAIGDLMIWTDISDTSQAAAGTTKKNKAQYGLGSQVNAQTGTTYTVLTTDFRKLVTHTNAAAIAVTLPQAGVNFPAGWWYWTANLGAGAVTITPTTSTINGAATLTLAQNESAIIFSDGTNYKAVKIIGSASGASIADDSVTNAKLANMAANTIKGNNTGSTADPSDLSVTDVQAMLATARVNAQTGTTYTLQASDNGKVVTCSNASAITVTVPSGLGAGFNCMVIQKGAGQVTFSPSSTTVNNRQAHTKTAGQHAIVTLFADVSDNFYLGGDTAS